MIKTNIPPMQMFKNLPSEVFFLSLPDKNTLYQTIMPFSLPNTTEAWNAIRFEEKPSGQRGSVYNMRIVHIDNDKEVQRVTLVNVDMTIASHLTIGNKSV